MEMTKRISSLAFFAFAILFIFWTGMGQDLPFRSEDKFQQTNNDDISSRGFLRKPDYGRVALTGGSSYVALNIDYLSPDTFITIVGLYRKTRPNATDSLHTYFAVNLAGDSIAIYAMRPQGVRDLTDTSTVNYVTFLKDR
jgi:hypothetical protein